MIVDPKLDVYCMSKLTAIARYELGNPLVAEYVRNVYAYARRRRMTPTEAVFAWLQSLPQTDDDGGEEIRAIACNPRQRLKPFADDPNCFERALTAIILLQLIDPRWFYTLGSVDEPLSHTGVMRSGSVDGPWETLNLFPSKRGPRALLVAMEQAQQAATEQAQRAQPAQMRNVSGQDIFTNTIHPIGYAVLDRFAGKDAANFVTGQERRYGLLRRPAPHGPLLHAPELRAPAPLVVPGPLPPTPSLRTPELRAELSELMPPQGDMDDAEPPTEAIAWTPFRRQGGAPAAEAPAPAKRWRLF